MSRVSPPLVRSFPSSFFPLFISISFLGTAKGSEFFVRAHAVMQQCMLAACRARCCLQLQL